MQMQLRFTLFFLLICGISQAQNTSSPYSIFGIGDIQTSAYNRTTGLGSTGIAYRSETDIIQNNPASYTALIQQYFHVEVGGRAQFSTYTGAAYSNNIGASDVSNDFSPTRIAFATKINQIWGSSMGMMPYSTMNYSFTGLVPISGPQGSESSVDYEGTGGLHKAYWGNGFRLGKHLSLGFTSSFLFGALQESQNIVNTDANANITSTRNLYLRNVNFDFGGQFYTHLDKEQKWGLGLGATFSPQQRLYATDSLSVIDNGSTLINLNNYLLDENILNIPMTYGAGLSLSKDSRMKKMTFVADYQRQQWSPLSYTGSGFSLQNSDRYSAGLEIVKRSNILNTPVEHIYYQIGGFYNKTYLTLNGYPVIDWGASVGIGVTPLRYPKWGYNIAFEYGTKGNYELGTVREDYARLTITIHYFDVWFTRGHRLE
jgi:hypothetical protein